MKKTNINVLIVTMLLLCAALSMGCLEEEVQEETKEHVVNSEPTVSILEPAKLEIKDIRYTHDAKYQRGTAILVVKNIGDITANDVQYALVTIYGNKQTLSPDLEKILEKEPTFSKEEIKAITLDSMKGDVISIERKHESITGEYNVTFFTKVRETYIGDILPNEVKESSYPCYDDPMEYTTTMIVYTKDLKEYDIYDC